MPITYKCNKCGCIVEFEKEDELEEQKKIHSKICDGELMRSVGKCLEIAFCNLILINPNWKFCYGRAAGKIEGQTFIHSWNEDLEGHVIDRSQVNDIIMNCEDYYKKFRITNIKKFNIKQVFDKINQELQSGRNPVNIWWWI